MNDVYNTADDVCFTDKTGNLMYQIGPRTVDLFGDVDVPEIKDFAQFFSVYIWKEDNLWEWVKDFDTETQARDFVAQEMENAGLSPRQPRELTPDDIAQARSRAFVLADFGRGFEPATWSPVDQGWMVCRLETVGNEPLQKRWFKLEMVSESQMVDWIPV